MTDTRTVIRQFAMYAAVGLVGTAAHYSVLIALVQTGIAAAPVATTCGYVVGAFINYRLNYRFTFDSSLRHSDALPKFLLVAATGAALNYLIVWTLTRHEAIHYLVAQLVSTTIVLLWQYAANRAWTFAKRSA